LVFLKTIEDPTVDVATKKAAFDGLYTKLYSDSASPAPAVGQVFDTEEAARAAGHGSGSTVKLKGIGTVRLK
jgi:hypothetical protein